MSRSINDPPPSRAMVYAAVCMLATTCPTACVRNQDHAPTSLRAEESATQRFATIAALYAEANANDSKDKGFEALASLNELLTLDPQNADAVALRHKILGYYQFTNSIGMVFDASQAGEIHDGEPA
jgi:hypothetical protein